MLKRWLVAVALASLGLVQAQAQAQTAASPTKKELVAKVLTLQQGGIEALSRNLTEQPAMQIMQQVGPVLQRLPTERRDAVARDIEADLRKYVEDTTPLVRDKAVKLAPSTIGVLLDEKFTEDELKQVIALLESPVNRKFQSMTGEMQRVISEKLVADARSDVEPKLQALQQTVAKRLGMTPQPGGNGGEGKPAAKPAASPPKK